MTRDANPITGRDLTATVALHGALRDAELCGGIVGEVVSPIQAPLTPEDSTFGVTWVGGIDEDVQAALRVAPIQYTCGPCPE